MCVHTEQKVIYVQKMEKDGEKTQYLIFVLMYSKE